MKITLKNLSFTTLFLILILSSYAQENNIKTNRINVSFNSFTSTNLTDDFRYGPEKSGRVPVGTHVKNDIVFNNASITLGYQNILTKKITLESSLRFEYFRKQLWSKQSVSQSLGNSIVFNYTASLRGLYNHYTGKNISIYSGIGIGYNYSARHFFNVPNSSGPGDYREKVDTILGHFTALGIRIGNTFSIFTEVGYGYMGMVNSGLGLKF